MAQYVNVNRNVKICFFSLFLLSAGICYSQELKDPTRPANLGVGPGGSGTDLPVLQSVLIAPDRKFAIIDGKTVRLNGKFGDQVLVKLTETEATLKRGKVLQTLKLFPDVEKKIIRDAKAK